METRLKILISAHIRWYNAEAEYVHRLARGLIARGIEAAIWTTPGSPLAEFAKRDNIPVVTGGDPASIAPAKIIETARLARALIRERGFNLLNAHRSEGFPVLAYAARREGAAVVRTRGDMRMPKLVFINREIYRRAADLVIASNDLLRENLVVSLGLPPERTRTIRFGINPDEAAPAADPAETRKKLGINPADPLVGVMGRLGPVKGQEFVLRAADEVAAASPDAKFLVIYRDLEQSDKFLPALRRSPHKNRFLFVGPGRGRLEAMRAADVAVIPSVGSEANCRVALEWMALSKPVIGSRVGVIPEIIVHGETGFLVQPRYSQTLARCMIELLNHPERARSMGRAGRERLLEHFSEERMVEQSIAAFQDALKAR